MVKQFITGTTAYFSNIGSHPDDTPEIHLQKKLLVLGSLMFSIAGIVWGLIYFYFDERLTGLIPFTYGVITALNIVYFRYTARFNSFRFTQLLFGLMLPFSMMVTLGGFHNSSVVILWAFMAPLGAFLYYAPRDVWKWFIAFGIIVIISAILQPFTRAATLLPNSIITIFYVLNIITVTGLATILLVYLVNEKNEAFRLLRIEQEKSEKLLLNILPKEIARILKTENKIIADDYEQASILFADLVGFTPMSAQMEPKETVEFLNFIYSSFDSLVEKYDLEKIRTIGDNYMVASGVPTPRSDHAQALATLALDMNHFIQQLPSQNGTKISFKIGINSGPLVAGVIGKKKFHYDVWGDAVNTASRMESQGLPDKIQVTQVTYELLRDDYDLEPRGLVNIKGKGDMETWFLIGRRTP